MKFVLIVLALLIGATQAQANTTYTYTGPTFSDYQTPPPLIPGFPLQNPFEGGHNSASFTLTQPLAPNTATTVLSITTNSLDGAVVSFDPSFLSASLNNAWSATRAVGQPFGVFANTNGLLFRIITDELGGIIDWAIGGGSSTKNYPHSSAGSTPAEDSAYSGRGPSEEFYAWARGGGGTWSITTSAPPTVVPLPATLWLFLGAFLALVFMPSWSKRPSWSLRSAWRHKAAFAP